jgi:hypothetical protein
LAIAFSTALARRIAWVPSGLSCFSATPSRGLQGGQDLRRSLVGHRSGVEASLPLEHLGGEHDARRRVRVVELALAGARVLQELFKVGRGHFLADHEGHAAARDRHHRLQFLQDLKLQVLPKNRGHAAAAKPQQGAVWCQGFSEPSAGSDLASLSTRAELKGDRYLINGSKVWTSYAGLAQHCFLLARTGGPGRRGIAIFLVPMDTPGITVRPIPSLIGDGDIHEVFFENVEVPVECRLGEEGQAWAIIGWALSHERVGIARYAFSRRVLDRMVRKLQDEDRFEDQVVKLRAGQALAACEAARLLVYKVIDQRARGLPPSADSNLARVAVIAADRAVADFGIDFLGETYSGDAFPLHLSHHERAIAAGIAAGAAEIQLNLIAYDHLGLPREARA